MRKSILFIFILIFLMAVAVIAQTASFSFYQEPLDQAFNDISEQFGIPIVVDKTINGRVTMALKDVRFDEAMNTICSKFGLFYFKKKGVYFVGSSNSSSAMKVCGYSTYSIPLKYLQPEDAISFLSPYTSYITYVKGVSMLFFSGPQNVYSKIIKTLRSVDALPKRSFVVYTLYRISRESYITAKNAYKWLDKLINEGKFSSVDVEDFTKIQHISKVKSTGFAAVIPGKSVEFKDLDLGMELDTKVVSESASGVVLDLSLSSTGTPIFEASSTVLLRNENVAVTVMKTPNENFVFEVSVVKTSPNISRLADLWPGEKEERNLFMRSNISTVGFDALMRYYEFAIDAGYTWGATSVGLFTGISGSPAQELWEYLLVGADLPVQTDKSYKVKLKLVQTNTLQDPFLSSGILDIMAPLMAIDEFMLEYSGTLEWKYRFFLLGGSMTYSFDSTNSAQSVDLFLKAGIYSRNGSICLYYSPL
ncbi:MAG: hypothetical protein DRP50_05915, partial [Thermotoga sp.]